MLLWPWYRFGFIRSPKASAVQNGTAHHEYLSALESEKNRRRRVTTPPTLDAFPRPL